MSNSVLTSLENLFSTGELASSIEKKRLGDSINKAAQAYLEKKTNLELLFNFKPLISLLKERPDLVSGKKHNLNQNLQKIIAKAEYIISITTTQQVNDFRHDLNDLCRDIDLIKQELKPVWEGLITNEFYFYYNLCNVLRKCNINPDLTRNLGNITESGIRLKVNFPPTESKVNEFKELNNSLKLILENLPDYNIDQEKINFLLAVAENRATISNISSSIFNWLKSENALELFKLSL
jgi:hypothetical protein